MSENDMEFKFQHPKIKLYWNTAIHIYYTFSIVASELQQSWADATKVTETRKPNIFSVALYRINLSTHIITVFLLIII